MKSPLSSEVIRDKVYGTIFGAAVADAVGLATEFLEKYQASFHYGVDVIQFDQFLMDQHRLRWIPGDFTDDTDQLLLILENLLRNGGSPNASEFAQDLWRWSYEGFSELGDRGGMGIGATVVSVLRHPDFIDDPHKAAKMIWEKSGKKGAANGAVMRTAILGFPHFDSAETVIENTLTICRTTHADPRCEASCLMATLCIAQILSGKHNPIEDQASIQNIIEEAMHITSQKLDLSSFHDEFSKYINPPNLQSLKLGEKESIGYTLKAIGAGLWALKQSEFQSAVLKLTYEAGDADTNGAVAGALLGCKLGFGGLPSHWVQGLIHQEWLASKAEALCALLGV